MKWDFSRTKAHRNTLIYVSLRRPYRAESLGIHYQGRRFALPLARVAWRFQRSEQFPQKVIARNNGVWAPCGAGSTDLRGQFLLKYPLRRDSFRPRSPAIHRWVRGASTCPKPRRGAKELTRARATVGIPLRSSPGHHCRRLDEGRCTVSCRWRSRPRRPWFHRGARATIHGAAHHSR